MPARCVPTAGPSPQAGGVLSLPSLCPLVIFGETEGFYDPDAIWVPGGGSSLEPPLRLDLQPGSLGPEAAPNERRNPYPASFGSQASGALEKLEG